MLYKKINKACVVALGLVPVGMMLLSSGCATSGTDATANLNSSPGAAATANANAGFVTEPAAVPLEAREPERYSVTTSVTIQPTGNAPQANVPTLQFTFARLETDR